MVGGAKVELVRYCPYCGSDGILKMGGKHFCSECLVYLYIQVECLVNSPLLEVSSESQA